MRSPIAVFGEILVDRFASGPLVGGAPFNVARHLAAFGCAPLVLSAVGDDTDGRRVRAEFDRFALRREGLQVLADRSTGVVDVIEGDAGHAFRIGGACAYDAIGPAAVDALRAHAEPGGWLCHGTLALRGEASRRTWRSLIASHAGPVFVDLNWRDGQLAPDVALEALGAADVLELNDDECALLASWLGVAADAAPAAIVRRLGLRLLIVTRGAEGHAAFGTEGDCVAAAAAQRVAVVDTVGAGDAFAAVVLVGLVRGWPVGLALDRAGGFAALVCSRRGAVPALADYARAMRDWA